MLVHERQQAILNMLQEQHTVKISEIARTFGVSSETARRDLEYLQQKKFLRRIHGGAVLVKQETQMQKPDLSVESPENISEPEVSLAKAAFSYVEDNDIILVGPGHTMHQLACCLHKKEDLTVLTNSLSVINELADSNLALYSLGGRINPDERNMYGSIPNGAIQQLYATKAFLSCGGISREGVVSDYAADTTLQKLMLQHAEKRYLVAVSDKFGRTAFGKVCDIQQFDVVITDDQLPKEFQEIILQANVELRLVSRREEELYSRRA